MMKSFLLGILSIITITVSAQPDAATKAREHMFKALTVADGIFIEDLVQNIERSPWEALAYLEEGQMLSVDDLQEAVADYYHFKGNLLYLKLIDPKNLSEFGTELTIPFRLDDKRVVSLINPKTLKVEDSWDILYLDKNYMALDMGDIRVFFIHTIVKE